MTLRQDRLEQHVSDLGGVQCREHTTIMLSALDEALKILHLVSNRTVADLLRLRAEAWSEFDSARREASMVALRDIQAVCNTAKHGS